MLPFVGMTLSAIELDRLADALATRLASLMGGITADAVGDVHDAAKWLGCSVPTIERGVKDGTIPSIKVGKRRRYRRSDLLGMSTTMKGESNV